MSYKNEFPAEYHDVPSVILDLVERGLMDDASWHNDASPHFAFCPDDDEPAVELWFDALNPADREYPEGKRFMVFVSGNHCVLQTDDAARAANLAVILIAAAKDSFPVSQRTMSNAQAFEIVRNMAKMVVRGRRESEAIVRMEDFDAEDLFPLDDTQDANGLTVGTSAPLKAGDTAVDAVARAFSEIVRRDLADHLEEINRKNISLHEYCDANMLMGEAFEKVMGREDDAASKLDTDIWNNAWDKAKAAHYSL